MQQQTKRNQRKGTNRSSKKFQMTNSEKEKYRQLLSSLHIEFENIDLYIQAFTHSSYVNEYRIRPHDDNERLEFLGDAVLELAISQYLFKHYKKMSEGEMTKLRAAIVCEPSLAKFANELKFGDYVLLGKGEELTGGRSRPALLADIFESFIGALFLDKGMDDVDDFLSKFVYPKINDGDFVNVSDYKSQLQEYIQRENQGNIQYKIVEEKGPAHAREFVSEVWLENKQLGVGIGRSKKEAEQMAAQQAIEKLEK